MIVEEKGGLRSGGMVEVMEWRKKVEEVMEE